jgi:hypothetical protein
MFGLYLMPGVELLLVPVAGLEGVFRRIVLGVYEIKISEDIPEYYKWRVVVLY